MAENRWNNIKAALRQADSRTRLKIVAAFCFIGVAAVSGAVFMTVSKGKQRADISEIPPAPVVQEQTTGPVAATPAYDKLVATENAQIVDEARSTGKSAIPVLRVRTEAAAEAEPPPPPPMPDPPKPEPQQQPAPPAKPNMDRELEMRASAIGRQVNLLIQAWAPKEHTSTPVHSLEPEKKANVPEPSNGSGSASTADEPIARAGHIYYAQLETAVNSDEPGPVLATIVEDGPLKGARLVGRIELPRNAEKALLSFNLMSLPGYPRSVGINAYAVDPDTKRTALASDVDHHYLLRYGTLFATSFLEGIGDFLMKGGQNQRYIATNNTAIVQTEAYEDKDIVIGGISNVGKRLAQDAQQVVNRPPTITVNAGIGMGILFMTDVTLK